MADLNKKADGKVKVADDRQDARPQTAADGCPANVKASVDATNKAVTEISAVVDNMGTLTSQSQELAKQSETVHREGARGHLELRDQHHLGPKVTKTIKTNVGIVEQTPGR
jgi:hypothetical protein